MTARKDETPTTYTRSQEKRQQALDLARSEPGITGAEILHRFKWDAGTGNSRLKGMCDSGEMSRTEIKVKKPDCDGRMVTIKTYQYYAIALKTIAAEMVRRKAEHERKPNKPKVAKVKEAFTDNGKTIEPGYYKQRGGGWQANPKSGGQGSIERRVYVGSVMG